MPPEFPRAPKRGSLQPSPVEALLAAQKLVDMTEKQHGPQAVQLVNPLIGLASRNTELNDDVRRRKELPSCDAIGETHEGANSHDLITAFAGLGAIYAENRRLRGVRGDMQTSASI